MASDRRKIFFTYDHIHRAVAGLVPSIQAFCPDVIVAIGGGGFIPARMLRTHVRVPVLAVSLELYDDATRTTGTTVRRLQWLDDESEQRIRGRRVLVVDEVDDSRATLAFCCTELLRSCSPAAVAVAVVHDKARPKVAEFPAGVLHLAAETLPGDCWVCYPWDAAAYGLSIEECSTLASRPRYGGDAAGSPPIETACMPRGSRALRGSFLHAPERGREAELLDDAVLVVSDDGVIEEVFLAGDPGRDEAAALHEVRGSLTVLPADVRVLPGFVDLHVHAPQWGQLGHALDRPLSEWLQTYTFPLEARFSDEAYAAGVYAELVQALLGNGTTTAVYYASLHLPATRKLAEACLRAGQRALVGKVAMDNPEQCPDYYRDVSAEAAVAETRALIDFIRTMPGNGGRRSDGGAGGGPAVPPPHALPLVLPVITPRFIPSCTDELLAGLGALAAETGAHVQTHCSESDWEHAFALGRFGCTDTAALDRFGLLTRRTILGHGNYVTPADVDTIVARGSAIAHCPLSNIHFAGSVFPLHRLLDSGVHIGLGTDIAGGASPSLLENARMALLLSVQMEAGLHPHEPAERRTTPGARVDPATALWLATAGAAEALDLPVRVGAFRRGYRFDAVAFWGQRPGSNLQLRTGGSRTPSAAALPAAARAESVTDQLQKILYHATRDDIAAVWVDGRCVAGTA